MADPAIRFCRLADGTRVAYSTHGAGPLLVCPAWWVSHLERDWKQPAFRAFFTALARHRTVVRYDRPGVGLSDRDRLDFTQETEVAVLDAVLARLARSTVDLLAFSCAAPVSLVWAAANPEQVRKLVLIGAYTRGADLGSDAIRDALTALVRAHWGMGAAAINRLFSPDLSVEDARAYGRDQLASASADTAARLLGLSFAMDSAGAAARVRCPALVLHREGDQTVRFDAGRDLAAELPDGMFKPLPGGAHLPWLGDAEPILAEIVSFLEEAAAPAESPVAELSWICGGDIWTIHFEGRTIHVKHAKGLADLSQMLGRPGQPVEALQLYAGTGAPPSPEPEPLVDRKALAAYRSRLADLATELDAARQQADLGRTERARAEQEVLLAHLGQITGPGGRPRTGPSPAERARKAVSARIRDAIAKVGSHHPELAAHLTAAVSTGATCVYRPDEPLAWNTRA